MNYSCNKLIIRKTYWKIDNTTATTTLFEARTGTLKLNTIKRHNDEDINRRYVIIQMKT